MVLVLFTRSARRAPSRVGSPTWLSRCLEVGRRSRPSSRVQDWIGLRDTYHNHNCHLLLVCIPTGWGENHII